MRPLQLARFLVLLGVTPAGLVRGAAPDSRLAGYWSTPADAAAPAAFTFSIFGKWTIVSPHLAGVPDSRFRYTVEATDNSGTLTMDEPPAKQAGAPKVIRYELQGGELTLEFPGPTQPIRLALVKGTRPASRPVETANTAQNKPATKPAPRSAEPPKPTQTVLGSWSTEPGTEKQLIMFISRGRTSEVMINQQWIKGSGNPVVARNTSYNGTFANGRGTLTMAQPDHEGSLLPPLLYFTFEGEVLVITVDDGHFAGQYRLSRKAK
jgi:hypothetical protein